jgi:hypothetical protein
VPVDAEPLRVVGADAEVEDQAPAHSTTLTPGSALGEARAGGGRGPGSCACTGACVPLCYTGGCRAVLPDPLSSSALTTLHWQPTRGNPAANRC